MEPRTRKFSRPPPASPDRSRPSPPPPPKQHKIPVVYYLCRNRHLEHPHFMEVPLPSSSPHSGLYLRDFIHRLTALRGKAMPAMYSWSCKRSYKNGFVWHDLAEDDLVLPALGNEYVLKGSELLDQSPPPAINPKVQQQLKISSRTHEASSSSSSSSSSSASPSPPINLINEAKTPPASHSPPAHRPGTTGEFSPAGYRVYKPRGAADASTQTDVGGVEERAQLPCDTCTRGVSTEDGGSLDLESEDRRGSDEISPPLASSSASSYSDGKTETLESLIRAEASKMNSFRILEEEEVRVPAAVTKLKATDMLMQLITCGSISVKDHHSFGLVPTYRPRFSHVRFCSPMFSGSLMMGELECLSENPRLMGLRLEDKEYFSGSLIETKKHTEDLGEAVPTLKRSSSYNADRSCKSPDSKREKDKIVDSSRSKCLPRTIKMTSNKQSRNETMRSPLSDCPRNSSVSQDCSQSSKGGSKRITDAASDKGSSMRLESFKEEKGRLIKIEERLTSGARVIIQSRAPGDDSEGSSSS